MAKKYYKVVYRDGNKLVSSALGLFEFPKEFAVEYKVGEFVGPVVAGTRLFVFRELGEAVSFRRSHGTTSALDIYECEVKNPSRKTVPIFSLSKVKAGWDYLFAQRRKKVKLTINGFLMMSRPANAWTATAIKLIKKID